MIIWANLSRDERLGYIKPLWIEGKSAQEIADTIVGASRQAVIGVIFRNGLQRRDPRIAKIIKERVERKSGPSKANAVNPSPKPRLIIAGNGSVHEKPESKLPRGIVSDHAFSPLPGSQPIPWTERAFGQCAWPVGGDGADTLSCGLACGDGAYCEAHLWLRKDKARPTPKVKDLIRSVRRVS